MEDRTRRQRQMDEAEGRLALLQESGLHPSVLRDFLEEDRTHYSERTHFLGGTFGALFWIDQDPVLQRAVERAEQEFGCVVYHAIRERTEFGELFDLLYVSKHEEEWEDDRLDLAQGFALAYVVNLDDDSCSEFGGIGFQVSGGGLVRTA